MGAYMPISKGGESYRGRDRVRGEGGGERLADYSAPFGKRPARLAPLTTGRTPALGRTLAMQIVNSIYNLHALPSRLGGGGAGPGAIPGPCRPGRRNRSRFHFLAKRSRTRMI